MIDRGMLEYVLNRIRPQIQADGGDLKVTKIDDDEGVVYVALQGACVDCPMSTVTMSQGVERVVMEHVPGVKHVRADMQEPAASVAQADAVNAGTAGLANMGASAGMGANVGMGMGSVMGGPMAGMGDEGYKDNPYLDWEDDDE